MRARAPTLLLLAALLLPVGARGGEAFTSRITPVPGALAAQMTGTSWHAELTCGDRRLTCPPLDGLVLLTVSYRDPAGAARTGHLVVAREAAPRVRLLLETLWHLGFPIARMVPVSRYGGDDGASMAADNTSAFNCRCTTGGSRLSNHAHGRALDLNPVENPYVTRTRVLPPAGAAYRDRDSVQPGMLTPDGCAVAWARALGFQWGGDWRRLKDWQHLELPADAGPAPSREDAATRVPERCRWGVGGEGR